MPGGQDGQEVAEAGAVAVTGCFERDVGEPELIFEELNAKAFLALKGEGAFDFDQACENFLRVLLHELVEHCALCLEA